MGLTKILRATFQRITKTMDRKNDSLPRIFFGTSQILLCLFVGEKASVAKKIWLLNVLSEMFFFFKLLPATSFKNHEKNGRGEKKQLSP